MNTLIVNPNPVFDRTINVVELIPGAVIRTLAVELTAGGKGINVARVLRALGRPARMLLPIGADDRGRYESLLASEGAEFTSVEVPGGVRTASIYLEERSSRVTVVNDAGSEMAMTDWQRVRGAVRGMIAEGDLVLCMGSFPPGLPMSAHRPDIITPNLDEAEAALEAEAAHVMDAGDAAPETARPRAEHAALALCEKGAGRALVTAGAAGVAMAHATEVTWIPAYPVNAVSTVGAGDSFVAGLAFELAQVHGSTVAVDWLQAVRVGVAAAAASCELVRAGGAQADRIKAILADLEGAEPARHVVGSVPA